MKESGIPFREHMHPPEFDPTSWYYAICAAEEWEVEDPAPEPVVAIGEQGYVQRVIIGRFAPLFPGIEVWIAWLVEVLRTTLFVD